jgi:hypothetical protein
MMETTKTHPNALLDEIILVSFKLFEQAVGLGFVFCVLCFQPFLIEHRLRFRRRRNPQAFHGLPVSVGVFASLGLGDG